MRTKSFWSTALLFVMMTLVASAATIGAAAQQEAEPWVHVDVTSDSGTNLNLNLPLAAVTAMLALTQDVIVQNGEFQFGSSHQVPVAAIRDMWRELRDVGDVEFVTIQNDGQDVRIAREGDTILVHVSDSDGGDDSVRVEIPVPVVDALLSGDGDTLNIRAAIEELSTLRGELVRVIESDNNIRIWIDESPTQ